MSVRKRYGAPEATTQGNVGDLYVDLNTGKVYRCEDIVTDGDEHSYGTVYTNRGNKNTVYVWKSTGASSYNELEDKPFYVEEGGGSWALEYKGQEGVVLVETRNGAETRIELSEDLMYGPFLKISDTPLTHEQAKALVLFPDSDNSIVVADIWNDLVNDGFINDDCIDIDGVLVIHIKDPGKERTAIRFDVGVYVDQGAIMSNMSGFGVIATFMDEVVHPLDPKFLPDGYPYEEEKVVKEPLDITFSNMGGLDVIVFNPDDDMWGTVYKLSDADMTVEQIKNLAIDVIGVPDGDLTMSVAEDWDKVEDEGTEYEHRYVTVSDSMVDWAEKCIIFTLKDNVSIELLAGEDDEGVLWKTVTLPTKGIYAVQDWTLGGQYTMRVYAPEVSVTKNVTHPIDPKFLPDNVGGGVKYVTIGENDDGNFTSSATYDEIAEWIAAGMDVKCVYGKYVLNLIYSSAMSDVSTFSMEAQLHEFNVLDPEEIKIIRFAILDNGEVENIVIYLARKEK